MKKILKNILILMLLGTVALSIGELLTFNVVSTLARNVGITLVIVFRWNVIMDSLRRLLSDLSLIIDKLVYIRLSLSGNNVNKRIHL